MVDPDAQLFRAIYLGNLKAVKSAILHGANPDSEDPSSGLKPIHFATCNGNVEIVKELLRDTRVRADSIDRKGRVPYEFAADFGHSDIEQILIDHIFQHPELYGRVSKKDVQHHMLMHLTPA